MKHKLVFVVCCLLVFTGFNAAAQENTAPLPPPDEGILKTAPFPPTEQDEALPASDSRTRTRAQAPAPSGGTARSPGTGASGTGSGTPPASGSRARSPAPAARPAAATSPSPEGIPEEGWFLGAMLGGSFYIYDLGSYSDSYDDYSLSKISGKGGFNFDFFLGHDFGLLAAQVEFLFTGDKARIKIYRQGSDNDDRFDLTGTTIQIPVTVKLDLHWGRFMLQPQAGLYLNFGLGDLDVDNGTFYEKSGIEYDNPLFGLMVGGALGFRVGRGYFFADFRYTSNLGDTNIEDGWDKYHRSAFMIYLGYQYYLKGKQ